MLLSVRVEVPGAGTAGEDMSWSEAKCRDPWFWLAHDRVVPVIVPVFFRAPLDASAVYLVPLEGISRHVSRVTM